ncbi:hypothetical protein [Paenibacillus ottowii]
MLLNMKKRIAALMATISEMVGVLPKLSDPVSAISDCLAATGAIQSQLSQEEIEPQRTIGQIQIIEEGLNVFLKDNTLINEESVEVLFNQSLLLQEILQDEIKAKLNVVFFPYKASMWDSLATVYEAATKDNDCVVHVVPIPYYQLSQNEAIPTYEGNLFPKDIQLTHYSQYNLDEQRPDVIFVHNIYDQYNTLTRVHEQYFTSNLKKYTDMLVYVPYHIPSFYPPKQGDINIAYNLVAMENVDKVILAGDFLKKSALNEGVPEDKLLVLGTPKFDALFKALNDEMTYPVEWKKKINGKTVYLINTGCLFFAGEPFEAFERLIDFFSISRIAENSVVIWRPHPLTKISIMKYTPYFLDYYIKLTEEYIKGGDELYNGIILDETSDYIPALKIADVLISADGSLLRSYLLTEKKVLYWDEKSSSESLLPSDVFYYAFDRTEPWYQLVKKFSTGYDPLAGNRKGLASRVYTNTDGSSGEKIYQSIKESVLLNR